MSEERSQTLVRELKAYKILMVPGFFSNNVIALGNLPLVKKFKWGEQFDDYTQWFTAHDIENERLRIESEADPEYNAEIIRKSILESRLPVILISQSKGCVDSLVTLLKFTEIQEKVRAFLPLNGPFQGTPLADDAIELKSLNGAMDWILRELGGSIKSVQSLRVEDSQTYLKNHSTEIERLIQSIPLISFSARVPRDPKKWNTNFALPRNYLESKGYINDGLLPWQSSILPGSDYILIEGLDHATSIRYSKPIPFDRVHFFQTMLWMLRKRTAAQHF